MVRIHFASLLFFIVNFSLGCGGPQVAPVVAIQHFGGVRFDSDPQGAHVYEKKGERLDYIGKTPINRLWARELTEPKCYTETYLFRMSGYQDTEYPAEVCYGSTENENPTWKSAFVILQSASGSSEHLGTIEVTSDPAGASIFGDGKYWGQTPYSTQIRWSGPGGSLELRVELPGYVTVQKTITPFDSAAHFVLQPTRADPR